MDEFPGEKKGVLGEANNFKKIFLLGIILIIGVVVFFVLRSTNSVNPILKCGDGTFNEYCSLTKPYFCDNASLVGNPETCGCPDGFKLYGEACVFNSDYLCNNKVQLGSSIFCGCPDAINLSSENVFSLNHKCEFKYNSSTENMSFNYLISGVNGNLSFEFRQSVLDNLLSLPRFKVYSGNETPRRDDFKIANIDNSLQTEFLMPLVLEIENKYPDSKDMQAKVAISLVQNIPYTGSASVKLFGRELNISRYPYEVLGENKGSCEDKSELLAFLLKRMGFGVTLFYFQQENHESVGIKCPVEESYLGTGYCFVEATEPSPISFSTGNYLDVGGGIGKLESKPEFILIGDGISLSKNIPDYNDAKELSALTDKIGSVGALNPVEELKMNNLRKKYGLNY